jgi:dTDP-4-dehydrorhamnose 3,5-epimerase
VTSDSAIFSYKCTRFYDKPSERTVRWDDPDIGIRWPMKRPILSEKDMAGILLKDIPSMYLFTLSQGDK